MALGYKDWKDQYISIGWIVPSFIVFILYLPAIDQEHVMGMLLFGLPSLYMYRFKKHWIGSADVGVIFFFGFLLGYQRMMIAMFIALTMGILWSFKKQEVPFITCLCIGGWIAFRMGYKIWYHLIL